MKTMNPQRKMPLTALTGRIDHLLYANDTFVVGKIKCGDGETKNFAGAATGVTAGDYVCLYGQWIEHQKYGRQFKTAYFMFDTAPDSDGLAAWLAGNKEFSNIGPARAREIAERFGTRFDDMIKNHPDELLKIKGITKNTIITLRDAWLARSAFNAAATELAALDLTPHQINLLLEKYGGNAIAIIKENPYVLIAELDGIAFKRCDQIARRAGHPKDNPARIRAGLIWLMNDRLNDGHTCMDAMRLCRMANELLTIDNMNAMEMIKENLKILLADGEIVEIKKDEF